MFKYKSFLKYKIQIFATLAVCINAALHGVGLGWLSPAIIYLQSPESVAVGGPITNDEVSWLGSIFPVGSTCASLLFGYIGNAYGRKKALLCIVVFQLIFWSTIIFAKNITALYFARIMSGANAGSAFVTTPVFIAEISSKEIRGSLGSIFSLAISIGIVVGYTVGAYVPYAIMPRIFVGIPIIYFICIYKLPEAPQFLLLHGKENESKNSLKFYRNTEQIESTEAFENVFREFKENCLINGSDSKVLLSDFLNWSTFKILGHCFILGSIYLVTGGFIIINLIGSVFKETGANLDPNTSAIIVGISLIIGNYLSTLVANRMTRKNLLALSTGLTCFGLTITAIFVILFDYYEDLKNFSWIPILSISFTILSTSFGIMSMVFPVIAELVPQKIKSHAVALINILLNFVSFATFQIFSNLMFYFGLPSALFSCSIASIFAGIYILVLLPETSQKFV